jgi:hypothetical protein
MPPVAPAVPCHVRLLLLPCTLGATHWSGVCQLPNAQERAHNRPSPELLSRVAQVKTAFMTTNLPKSSRPISKTCVSGWVRSLASYKVAGSRHLNTQTEHEYSSKVPRYVTLPGCLSEIHKQAASHTPGSEAIPMQIYIDRLLRHMGCF